MADWGIPVGPWLRELKRAVLRGEPHDTPFRVWWWKDGDILERWVPIGRLKADILRVVPGQKISYATDLAYHPANVAKLVDLIVNSDLLFIEAGFLDQDRARAAQKFHLTAREAGTLARNGGAKRVIPLHFSPCYSEREAELRRELQDAFEGVMPGAP